MWKHKLGIDEATFEFHLINDGINTPREIIGCKMLPHITYNTTVEKIVKCLSVIAPLTFMAIYYFNLSDPSCALYFPDPKNYYHVINATTGEQ